MKHEKDLLLLSYLRQNSRITLKELSKKTGIPVSTIFDRIITHSKNKLITKHSLIFDFQKIGYTARATILLRIEKEDKEEIATYLTKHTNVNTLYKVNNGYDFIAECIFKNIQELEQFTEQLETKFTIKAKETHYVIHDLKREGFLSDPELMP